MGSWTSFWRAFEFSTRSVVIRSTLLSELNSSKFRIACGVTVPLPRTVVVLPCVVAEDPTATVAVGLQNYGCLYVGLGVCAEEDAEGDQEVAA